MKIYIAVVDGRRYGAGAIPFDTAAEAINYARNLARQLSRTGEIDESLPDEAGSSYHVTWGTEGECIWVFEQTLKRA